MKLKSIDILNFQSHAKTSIELDPGVNVIVGPSDVGKSSIMRAINWIITNKPSGESLRSNWGGDTEVHLDFEDGQIARIRSNKFNGYVLGMHDAFKGFGQTVPEEIAAFLNLGEANCQFQFDSPFMLSWTSGDRGRYLNKLVDLDITDETIKKLKYAKMNNGLAISTSLKDIAELEDKLEDYHDLDKMENRVEWIEVLHKAFEEVEGQRILLGVKVDSFVSLNEFIDRNKDIKSMHVHVNEIIFMHGALTETQNHMINLLDIKSGLQTIAQTTESLKDTPILKRKVQHLGQRIEALNQISTEVSRLIHYVDELTSLKEVISERTHHLAISRKAFNDLMPETCPLCGRSNCDEMSTVRKRGSRKR